jgi:hypothetical protein
MVILIEVLVATLSDVGDLGDGGYFNRSDDKYCNA